MWKTINHNPCGDRESKHKSSKMFGLKKIKIKILLHLMLFTKWLSSPLNGTAISYLLQMSLAWAFTRTQCLIADSERRV